VIKDAALVAVYGPRGSGKSTLTRALIDDRPNVVVFDPIGDYATLRGWAPVQLGMSEKENRKRLFAGARVAAKKKKFRMAVVPPEDEEEVCLHQLARWLMNFNKGYLEGKHGKRITLVVEEMDLSYPVNKLPKELRGMPRLCNQGRHSGIDAIAVTQFPQQISKTYRNNAIYTYAFRLPEAPRKAVEANMMASDKPVLRGLQQYEFIELSIKGMRRGKTLKSGKTSIK